MKLWFGGWRTRRIDAAVIAGHAETSEYLRDVVVKTDFRSWTNRLEKLDVFLSLDMSQFGRYVAIGCFFSSDMSKFGRITFVG